MAAEVAVDACHGGRTDDVGQSREDGCELAGELRVILQPVLLMVVFGQVEAAGGDDLSVDLPVAFQLGVPGLLGQATLRRVLVEDDGFVLCAGATTAGVMAFPEDLKQVLEGNGQGVEVYLEALRVITKVMVCGCRRPPSGVADTGPLNAWEAPELGVRAPESAEGQRGGFEVAR